jgi:hypothetical protein
MDRQIDYVIYEKIIYHRAGGNLTSQWKKYMEVKSNWMQIGKIVAGLRRKAEGKKLYKYEMETNKN